MLGFSVHFAHIFSPAEDEGASQVLPGSPDGPLCAATEGSPGRADAADNPSAFKAVDDSSAEGAGDGEADEEGIDENGPEVHDIVRGVDCLSAQENLNAAVSSLSSDHIAPWATLPSQSSGWLGNGTYPPYTCPPAKKVWLANGTYPPLSGFCLESAQK